jgi:HD-GYP domain-containing protein (c-di-GMP phosphodiesterase class II)
MNFSLNEFLISISSALDFIEMDFLGLPSNHGKRVAYMALKISEIFDLSKEEKYDLVSLSILHDNGIAEAFSRAQAASVHKIVLTSNESLKEHCIIGENNVKLYPFFTDTTNVIKYHHENYDGTGYFNIKGEHIPLMSQIICLANDIEHVFKNSGVDYNIKSNIKDYLNVEKGKSFSPRIVEAFLKLCEDENFWENIKDTNIRNYLRSNTPSFNKDLSLKEVRSITRVMSKIIDSKSEFTEIHSNELAEKAARMADYYKKMDDEKEKLIIAADLHDIGKLAISNKILDKPGKLTKEEFEVMKEHVRYSRIALEQISGFEDITEWAANHHEKLNGSGYPFGKTADELDFNSRLMACLDIYQALVEERPYRKALTHEQTMKILMNMQEINLIDKNIVNDIDKVFGKV